MPFTPFPPTSILGAIRYVLTSNSVVDPLIPGSVHANELPPSPTFPAVVLRWPRTSFGLQTRGAKATDPTQLQRDTIWKPTIEIWVDCLLAEEGEVAGKAIATALADTSLPYSGGQVIQFYPEDFFLAPEVGRNKDGDKQYSWCLVMRLWFLQSDDIPTI